MFLGALLHAGVDEGVLRSELGKLDIGPFTLSIESKIISSIESIYVCVDSEPRSEFRHLSAIIALLKRSRLPSRIIEKSTAVFLELAVAEAKVHGVPIEQVHFHEIGAVDTIIDVVGTVLGLHLLDIKKLISSPVPAGRGLVACAHGTLPLPAPAVCELLRGIPVYGVPIEKELVTPTGAALLKVLVDHFGPMEPMTIERTGYGAGSHVLPDHLPNLFRLIIGRQSAVSEAQSLAFTRGAPRPICNPVHSLAMKETILSETSAIGLRFRREQRSTLARELVVVDTRWGEIQAKKVWTPAGIVVYPEYEACREIAARHNVPLQQVYRAVCQGGEGTDKP